MFGINIDPQMGNEKFEYLIADIYHPSVDIPEGFVVKTIPAFTWAVFPCRGAMPDALQDVNVKIFSEWLPALKEYERRATALRCMIRRINIRKERQMKIIIRKSGFR